MLLVYFATMRNFGLLFGLIGALVGGASCVGDLPPDPPDGGDGGGSDGPLPDTGTPLLACAFRQAPGKVAIHTFASTIDRERFALVPMQQDPNTAVIVALEPDNIARTTNVWTWVVKIGQTDPTPTPLMKQTIVNSSRPLWVDRVSGGIGILTFDRSLSVSDPPSMSVYKLTEANIANALSTLDTFGPVLVGDSTLDNADGASLLPLDQNDYFVMAGLNQKASNGAYRRLFVARELGATSTVRLHALPVAPVHNAAVRVQNEIHAFLLSVNGTMLQPKQFVFGSTTADVLGTPQDLPKDFALSVLDTQGAVALALVEGDLSTGPAGATAFRVGTVSPSALTQFNPSALPQVNFDPGGGLAAGQAAASKWTVSGPQTPPHYVFAGAPPPGKGMQIYLFDADGTLRLKEGAQSKILPEETAMVGLDVVVTNVTAQSAELDMAWVDRVNNVDTIYFGKVACQ